ncbi:MAG: hypothetical protein V7K69_15820 [Nostoc sp.]|uniref:hypothetical protein n=1 Tax=Nostoc sp. TaxID=1180 RepID=UPI002FF5226B
MKAEVATGKTEATTGYAKHPNVKAEAAARKAEATTGCAKHPNVKAEAAARKTEVATEKINREIFWLRRILARCFLCFVEGFRFERSPGKFTESAIAYIG